VQNIARAAIEHPLYPWMLALACFIGGIWGIDTVGRLEDPAFPIKTVLIVTTYDGASAAEVEQEVTDVIEASLQELPYLKFIESKSVAGRSEVQVQLQEQFGTDDTPQIFDELRRRIREAELRLPPGTGTPLVEDDFGDIFGLMYAVSTPDYSAGEIRDISRQISTALKAVPRVAKVQTAGEPFEAIFIEIDHSRLTRLGLPIEAVFSSIAVENQVTAAGSIAFEGRRLRIAPRMAFDSVQALGDMRIGKAGSTEILRLSDVATITREPIEVPFQIIRHDGKEVFTVGVSITKGQNVVEVGKAVEARMQSLMAELPLGVEVEEIYGQHKVVEDAIQTFLRNLLLSVITVVAALCVFMGWRAGAVVGSVLLLTVMGTLGLMSAFGIELQRISLGALMVAMGMLVDNGIVVAEGMLIGVRRGLAPAQAAEHAVSRTQFPLLGATIIGILAFGPISLADDNSGHFLVTLFQVVCISLLLSWVLAVTVVPLFGKYLLRASAEKDEALYSGWAYKPYRLVLNASVRFRWVSTVIIVGIVGVLLFSFQFVKQGFFPNTSSPLLYIDYRLAEGADIKTTESDVIGVEAIIGEMSGIESISSFIGRGATRFTTIMNPEQPNSAYAQLVVRVADVTSLDDTIAAARERLAEVRPQAEVGVSRAEFTPGGSSKIEARFYGPDSEVLRRLANDTLDVYLNHQLIERKVDWRQPQLQLVPHFDVSRAQVAGITRSDLAQTLAFATLGVRIGLYRDDDKLIPIVARAPLDERGDIESLIGRLVWSPAQQTHIPMSQIVDKLALESDDATIYRRNRVRVIRALANPPVGHNVNQTFVTVKSEVEGLDIPAGYRLEWGGEYEANLEANETLTSKIPMAFGLMFLVTILMFGRLKQAIVIWLTVPMTVCGVVLALLATDLSFTFPSFLGLLSLSGMLIKNCIVLVDEIDKRFLEDGFTVQTLIGASVSRLRPVMLAAGTTIAGMAPLLNDVFFMEMAVCIMGGLAFATLITLAAVPVFYSVALGSKLSS
jgi:multidrug efflux pump subunit AcrB